MAQVLCRFQLTEVHRHRSYQEGASELVQVKLVPVKGPPFGEATPQGLLDMSLYSEEASAVFHGAKIGQEFDLLITKRAPEKKQEGRQ